MSKKNKTKDIAQEKDILPEDQEFYQDETDQDPEDLSAEDAEADQDPASALAELREEYEKEKDRSLRLFAEFENYKKRTARERMELFKTAGEDIMLSLLPVLDDFGRALKELKKEEDDQHYKGVELIYSKFRETLRSKGLEMMEVKPGDSFNAEIHEAISQLATPDKKMKGKIIDIVENGYTLGEKIIRYPKVVIGQ